MTQIDEETIKLRCLECAVKIVCTRLEKDIHVNNETTIITMASNTLAVAESFLLFAKTGKNSFRKDTKEQK